MTAKYDARAYWDAILNAPETFRGATRFLGYENLGYDPEAGWADGAFTFPEEAANPSGAVQGGMISAALDDMMSLAAAIIQPGPALSPTLQMSTSFLRPVPVGVRLKCRGEVVRQTRSAIFTEGTLYGADGTVLARATANCISRPVAT